MAASAALWGRFGRRMDEGEGADIKGVGVALLYGAGDLLDAQRLAVSQTIPLLFKGPINAVQFLFIFSLLFRS